MVDKLYIMLPEFKIKKKYYIKQAWNDFYKSHPEIVESIEKAKMWNFQRALDEAEKQNPELELSLDELAILWKDFTEKYKNYEWDDNAQIEFSKWFEDVKDRYYDKTIVEKVKYDYNQSPSKQSRAARNNAIIDMMWGVLTNKDTVDKILNPGGFDDLKIASNLMQLTSELTEAQLAEIIQKEYKKKLKAGEISKFLLTLNLNQITSLAKKYKKPINPLSPYTQVVLHQYNMTGAAMIGIYANHNANHAILQHTKATIAKEEAFILNGKELTSLHDIKNQEGNYITRCVSQFLSGAVDNVKDNVLYGTNQNTFTADASMLLARLGYSPQEIGAFMRQPIIMDITNKFFRASETYISAEKAIEETIEKWKGLGSQHTNTKWEKFNKKPLLLSELIDNIMIANDLDFENLEKNKYKGKSDRYDRFFENQLAIAARFQRILTIADDLSTITAGMRSDTSNHGAGPTIANTLLEQDKVNKINKVKTILNIEQIINTDDNIDFTNEHEIRKFLLKQPLPMMNAFYTLGIGSTKYLLGKYFPQTGETFNSILNGKEIVENNKLISYIPGIKFFSAGNLDVATINSIFNDFIAYYLTSGEFFGEEKVGDQTISMKDKRNAFINGFPEYFKKVVEENEDIASLELIKRLFAKKGWGDNFLDAVVFKNVGSLNARLKDKFSRDWEYLLHSPNPKAPILAINLLRYNFFRNGMAFGPSTFSHLAPAAVRKAIPGYVELLNRMTKGYRIDWENFIEQYIYNHLNNRKIVRHLPYASKSLIASKEGVKDSFRVEEDKNPELVKNKFYVNKELCYDYHYFVAIRTGKNYNYYRLASSNGKSADYVKIKPLGLQNNFLEYEYGKKAATIESVIDYNKKWRPDKKNANDEDITASNGEPEIIYNKSTSEEMKKYREDLEQARKSGARIISFREIMNTPGLREEFNARITGVTPNNNYKDANDNNTCK